MNTVALRLTGAQIEEMIQKSGWMLFHTRGIHRYYRHPKHPGKQITVPVHFSEMVPGKTLEAILERAVLYVIDL